MAYRATPETYFFVPESGGSPIPLTPREQPQVEIRQTANGSAIDPNLLLFGFGVLAVVSFLGLLAFLSAKK